MSACDVCGTYNPNGGLIARYVKGKVVGYVCAYRFGCSFGHARPENG